jgi:hypothetical protein
MITSSASHPRSTISARGQVNGCEPHTGEINGSRSSQPALAFISDPQEEARNRQGKIDQQAIPEITIPVRIGNHAGLDQQPDRPDPPRDMDEPGRNHTGVEKPFADDAEDEMHHRLEDDEVGQESRLGQVSDRLQAGERDEYPDNHVDPEHSALIDKAILRIGFINIPVHKLGKAAREYIFIDLVEHIERGVHEQCEQERILGQDNDNQIDGQENGNHHADLWPVFLEPVVISLESHGCLLSQVAASILIEPVEHLVHGGNIFRRNPFGDDLDPLLQGLIDPIRNLTAFFCERDAIGAPVLFIRDFVDIAQGGQLSDRAGGVGVIHPDRGAQIGHVQPIRLAQFDDEVDQAAADVDVLELAVGVSESEAGDFDHFEVGSEHRGPIARNIFD